MFGYTYITTNKENGSVYAGQKHGAFNPRYLGSGIILGNAIKKYGKNSFVSVLYEEAIDQNDLDRKEIALIAKVRELSVECYNITEGGFGTVPDSLRFYNLGRKFTDEHRSKISLALKGRTFSDEHKRKISEIAKLRPKRVLTQEQKEQIRQSHLNNSYVHSKETREKIANSSRGRVWTKEQRESFSKIRTGKKRKPHSEEARAKMSLSRLAMLKRRRDEAHISKDSIRKT